MGALEFLVIWRLLRNAAQRLCVGGMDCWRTLYHGGFVSDSIVPRLRSASESMTAELDGLSPDSWPAKSLSDGRRRDGWTGKLPRS